MPRFSITKRLYGPLALTLLLAMAAAPANGQGVSPASLTSKRQPDPASPDVEVAFARLLSLTTTAGDQKALKDDQAAWVASRTSHCNSVRAAESTVRAPDQDVRAACLASMDKQRLIVLKQMRLAMLLKISPQLGSDTPRAGHLVRRDNARPTVGLRVAPTGWLALAVILGDKGPNTYELYDVTSGLFLRSFAPDKGSGQASVEFSSNARVLVTGTPNTRGIQVWDVHTGDLLAQVEELWGRFVLSPDGRYVYFTDYRRGLGVYDLVERSMVGAFQQLNSSANQLAIAPDGKHVAVTSDDQLILLNVRLGPDSVPALIRTASATITGTERPGAIIFSADGQSLLVGMNTKRLERWSVPTLERQNSFWIAGTVDSVTRLGNNGHFAMRHTASPGAVPDVFVYDSRLHEGTIVPLASGGVYAVSQIAMGNALLLALQSELRVASAPANTYFRPLLDLFGVEPPKPADPVSVPSSQSTTTQQTGTQMDSPRPERRVVRCGGTTFICDPSDVLICNGRQIPCQ